MSQRDILWVGNGLNLAEHVPAERFMRSGDNNVVDYTDRIEWRRHKTFRWNVSPKIDTVVTNKMSRRDIGKIHERGRRTCNDN